MRASVSMPLHHMWVRRSGVASETKPYEWYEGTSAGTSPPMASMR